MKPLTKRIITVAAVVLFAVLMYFLIASFLRVDPESIALNEFTTEYKTQRLNPNGEITLIKVEGASAVMYKEPSKDKFVPVYATVIDRAFSQLIREADLDLEAMLAANPDLTLRDASKLKIEIVPAANNNIIPSLISVATTVIFIVILFVLFRQMMGSGKNGAMSFGKSRARANDNIKVRFNDVAGAEEEKEELKEIVDFLKSPKKFSELGARIPKGVLLVGSPGTGKTLFAKAVAGEANVPFFSISGSDFVEMYVGVGASRVRDMFEIAKKNMPCIVFIDEIDAVGRQRGAGMGGGHDEREQTLNQLLVEMDGFGTNDGIIVMAATNRADILDPALLRPGRFDRQIYVQMPDVRGREAILKVHARNKPLSPDINFKTVARLTAGFSGADIENLLNESAILAVRAGRKIITMKDVYEGINKVTMGPQKKSRLITESDKRITAYHEAGHAILAKLLPHTGEVHEVTIIPRGQALGYTQQRPDNDNDHVSKQKLLDHITVFLGGRAAEEIVIQDVCTGAVSDLQRSTEIARQMVMQLGMSELGPIYFGGDRDVFIGRDFSTHNNYSEEMNAKIDKEVKKIMDTSYKKALEMLNAHRSVLDNMTRVLVERETIYTDDVAALMEGKTAAAVITALDRRIETEDREGKPRNSGMFEKAEGEVKH